jgi:hypothetical protein
MPGTNKPSCRSPSSPSPHDARPVGRRPNHCPAPGQTRLTLGGDHGRSVVSKVPRPAATSARNSRRTTPAYTIHQTVPNIKNTNSYCVGEAAPESLLLGQTCGVKLEINTPALLFPAVSFLLLAYGNRYVAIAARIRQLAVDQNVAGHGRASQIVLLRKRVGLIRGMQTFAVASMLCCLISMLLLYLQNTAPGKIVFGIGLVLLIVSLIITLFEIQLSTRALDQELGDVSDL